MIHTSCACLPSGPKEAQRQALSVKVRYSFGFFIVETLTAVRTQDEVIKITEKTKQEKCIVL